MQATGVARGVRKGPPRVRYGHQRTGGNMKRLRYAYGWLFVRPRRWLFGRMLAWGSGPLYWRPLRRWDDSILWPHPHWWVLYHTVFRLFSWLQWNGRGPWRRLGKWAVGMNLSGTGECWHCGHPAGCPLRLSDDDTGRTFVLKESGHSATDMGTDYWYRGTTICPKCGYRAPWEDSSL